MATISLPSDKITTAELASRTRAPAVRMYPPASTTTPEPSAMPALTPTSESRARATAEAAEGVGEGKGGRVEVGVCVNLEVGDGADVGDALGPRPTVGLGGEVRVGVAMGRGVKVAVAVGKGVEVSAGMGVSSCPVHAIPTAARTENSPRLMYRMGAISFFNHPLGAMFMLTLNKLVGSYFRFTPTRRW